MFATRAYIEITEVVTTKLQNTITFEKCKKHVISVHV
jgi:hypothetical protein